MIPFLRDAAAAVHYCALRRADAGWWQWVAGGVEEGETPLQAAAREAREELGIDGTLYSLSMTARVPKTVFAAHPAWPADLYLVEEHCFAVELASHDVVLSHEHTEACWDTYEEAFARLHWQSNQTALWELAQRIQRDDLQPVLKPR